MSNWHDNNIELLSNSIVNEVQYLNGWVKGKNDKLYGVSVILDDDALTGYIAVSTDKSLENIHKKIKWDAQQWTYTLTNNDISDGIDVFNKLAIERYRNEIIPKFKEGFDYSIELSNNIKMFILALKKAKLNLIHKDYTFNDVIFFLTIPGEPKISIDSANDINESNELLHELIEFKS